MTIHSIMSYISSIPTGWDIFWIFVYSIGVFVLLAKTIKKDKKAKVYKTSGLAGPIILSVFWPASIPILIFIGVIYWLLY